MTADIKIKYFKNWDAFWASSYLFCQKRAQRFRRAILEPNPTWCMSGASAQPATLCVLPLTMLVCSHCFALQPCAIVFLGIPQGAKVVLGAIALITTCF